MRQSEMTLVVRIWQAPNGSLRASAKPAQGGETRHFSDLAALLRYLEQAQEHMEKRGKSEGLR